ncbi:DUF805 domain-containing protein [Nocardia huaxiensis]|uniref:DUF805 domain-containing protein n=1 Tax=Nocardia huaxiensis TaxID=2755382 RepID=UPI001C672F12|nr:DUF805 domain-containing protein [Nocardia huaxiensis]UFS94668.1 DUF805 domain-containing protein [Nocardia huaxiensis]
MNFGDAVRSVLTQYATFSGRARRSEYWWFVLFSFLVGLVASMLDAVLGTRWGDDGARGGLFQAIVWIALLLPTLAVGARRLHDIDRTAWWLLLHLIPCVGSIVLFVFAVLDGTPGPNQYGPDPKGRTGGPGYTGGPSGAQMYPGDPGYPQTYPGQPGGQAYPGRPGYPEEPGNPTNP